MCGAKNVNSFWEQIKRESTAMPITPCHCEFDTPDKKIFDCEHNKFLSGLILFWQVMKVLGDIV